MDIFLFFVTRGDKTPYLHMISHLKICVTFDAIIVKLLEGDAKLSLDKTYQTINTLYGVHIFL